MRSQEMDREGRVPMCWWEDQLALMINPTWKIRPRDMSGITPRIPA